MSARSLRLASILVSLLGTLAACGDDTGGAGETGSGGGTGQGGDAATTSTSTGSPAGPGVGGGDTSSTGAGAGPECPFPASNPTDPEPRAITQVTGSVSTTDGDPIAETEVQVCGKDVCLYGETDGAGAFLVNHNGGELDRPIVKAGDGLTIAKIGFALGDDGEPVATVVPAMADSGTVLAPGAALAVDGVELGVAADGVVALNILDFSGAGEDTFRAGMVPVDQNDAVAPGEGFDLVVGLGPHETRFCPPASLTLPNDADLPAGAAVEFFLYGLEVGQGFVPYGAWSKIADGAVSEDGASITTDPGEGIPVLGPVAVRLAE